MRQLKLGRYDDAIAEIERLAGAPYERHGRWSLGQACRHLSYYYRGSLDGFGFMLPWVVRVLVGRPVRRKLFGGEPLPRGARTIPASVPPASVDESAEIDEAKRLLSRLRDADGPLHPSPLLGPLTPDEWRTLHLRHTAHHLGLLVPARDGGEG